jgi:hypothetical protein
MFFTFPPTIAAETGLFAPTPRHRLALAISGAAGAASLTIVGRAAND